MLFLPFLLVLSAGFSAVETAIFRLDATQMRRLMRDPNAPSKRVVQVLSSRDSLLSALLLANTAVNIAFATIMTSVLLVTSQRSVPRYMVQALATAVSTVLILFWGEILPKTFAARRPALLALRFAGSAAVLAKVLRPLTFIADAVSAGTMRLLGRRRHAAGPRDLDITPETIGAAVDLGAEQGALPKEDQRMIHDALQTIETKVREIMTPRPYIVWLPDTVAAAAVLTVAIRSGHSRIPLYGTTVDNVTGVVYVKDLLPAVASGNLKRPASEFARKPYFVPDVKPVAGLLAEMRAKGLHLAIVLDEHGGTCGLVTMEDVVEEIVGEIADEFDRQETPPELVDGGYVLAARMQLAEINDSFGLSLPKPEDVSTVGGLVYALAGRVPSSGETFAAGPWRLTVEEMRGSRILKVRVSRAGRAAKPGGSRHGEMEDLAP